MPLYNKRPYVKRAIDSIQQQTFSDWELIIVDDGSTDGSSSEIPRHDSRIRLFHQENKGPGAARNVGISMALGEFVTFLDADDYYYPEKLEQEMDILHKKAMAEWMLSARHVEMDNKLSLRRVRDINGNKLRAETLLINNAISQLTLSGTPTNGLCISMAMLERVGGFNEEIRCYEIVEFVIRCGLIQPKVVVYPFPLFCVVKVPDSAYSVSSHCIEGSRQLGVSYYRLSRKHPQFSDFLVNVSRKKFLKYASALLRSGKRQATRRFLINEFPYSFDKKSLILWISTFQPVFFIDIFTSIYDKLTQKG